MSAYAGLACSNNDHVRTLERFIEVINNMAGHVWEGPHQVFTVGAHEAGEPDPLVVQPDLVPLAEESLDQLEVRTLAKIVGAVLERECQDGDSVSSVLLDPLQRATRCVPGCCRRMLSSTGSSTP